MALFFSENRKLWRFIYNAIMYKYSIADGSHPTQKVDVKEENLLSAFSTVENL